MCEDEKQDEETQPQPQPPIIELTPSATLTEDVLRSLNEASPNNLAPRTPLQRSASDGWSECTSRAMRRIHHDAVSSKSDRQKGYESWKSTKWGEDELSQVNLDADDLDIEMLDDVRMPTYQELCHNFERVCQDYSILRSWTRGVLARHGHSSAAKELIGSAKDALREASKEAWGPRRQIQQPLFVLWGVRLMTILLMLGSILSRISGITFIVQHFDRPILLSISFMPSAGEGSRYDPDSPLTELQ